MGRIAIVLMTAVLGLAACDMGPKSTSGFRLPDGDAALGAGVFVDLNCTSCHTVKGAELVHAGMPGPVSVELGGTVSRVKTYGDLVTSIINPSHKLSPAYPEELVSTDGISKMPIYNDVMTVQQVVDLVAFLQSHYDVVAPDYQYRRFGL